MRKPLPSRYRCRNHKTIGCPNTYTEVIGEDGAGGSGWGRKKRSGADCLPCYYAGTMRQVGSTPEMVEAVPKFMLEFSLSLARGGWTWSDVQESFARGATLA